MTTQETLSLTLEPRDLRKKKVRALRREGILPGAICGKGMESVPIQINAREFEPIYKQSQSTHIIKTTVGTKSYNVLVHSVQRNSLTGKITYIDFQKVTLKDRIKVEVPVVLTGTSPLVEAGKAKVNQETVTIFIKCNASAIPQQLEADLDLIKSMDDSIHATDLKLPPNTRLTNSQLDRVIASVTSTRAASIEPEATEGEEPAAEAAEE